MGMRGCTAALAAVLLAASVPAAAGGPTEAGLRLGWLRTTGAVRGLSAGVPAPEAYAVARRPGSPLSLEVSVSGYEVSGTESGRALYTSGGTTTPTSYAFSQDLLVIPMLATARLDRRRARLDLHAGAGLGAAISTLDRRLSFSDPGAEAAFGQTTGAADVGLETHAQAGLDWRFGAGWSAGAFVRWAYVRSGVGLYRGFRSADASGAYFAEGGAAGNASGLFAALSLQRRL